MATYKDAGVDIDAANAAKKSMKDSIDRGDPRVKNTLGAFASVVDGTFEGYNEPMLVLKTEEPGSKQKLAFDHGYERSICFDTINHLINDIAVMGAHPQYAQDLIICGKIDKDIVNTIVAGFADACSEQGCVLTGGETTEQPGVLAEGVYALAASVVGVVEKSKIIDGSTIVEGDHVICLPSNGLHTNGYTLVRSLMDSDPELANTDVDGQSFLGAIMQPHICYYQVLRELFENTALHGMAHITGGGVKENLNRILPKGLNATIDLTSIQIPSVFSAIKQAGNVEDEEMMRTFNMGIGACVVVSPESSEDILTLLKEHTHDAYVIGTIVKGKQNVTFEGDLAW